MFGYIKPFKPQLRICEYEAYQAVYCGLCGQLGKSFGPLARVTLSYDFTFLSILHFALSKEKPNFERRRCYVNPLKKIPACGTSEPLRFSADAAIIMIYYKLLDNMQDGHFFARLCWGCLRPFVKRAHRHAAERRPECEAYIACAMREQDELERRGEHSVDAAAEPTARAMASILPLLSGDAREQRVLKQLGYFIGRYVYLCDALDDLEQDLKRGGYNVFALKYGLRADSPAKELDKVRALAQGSLYAGVAEALKAYDLLEPAAFKPILDNIFLLGLRAGVDDILSKKKEKSQ